MCSTTTQHNTTSGEEGGADSTFMMKKLLSCSHGSSADVAQHHHVKNSRQIKKRSRLNRIYATLFRDMRFLCTCRDSGAISGSRTGEEDTEHLQILLTSSKTHRISDSAQHIICKLNKVPGQLLPTFYRLHRTFRSCCDTERQIQREK